MSNPLNDPQTSNPAQQTHFSSQPPSQIFENAHNQEFGRDQQNLPQHSIPQPDYFDSLCPKHKAEQFQSTTVVPNGIYPTLTVTTTTYQYSMPPQAVFNQLDDHIPISHPPNYVTRDGDSYIMMPDKKSGSSKHSSNHGHNKKREQKRILLKYSIAIFESDMESLNGWLSDAIVNFAAMHLYEGLPNHVKQEINIVQSTSCDFIKYDTMSNMNIIFNNLNIVPTKWQFFILNNNSKYGLDKGSHWSLLLFNPNTKSFFFVDSISNHVPELVRNFANKIGQIMNAPNYPVQNLKSPKMGFGGDCGIYAIEYLNCIFNNICHQIPWQNFESMENIEYMKSRRGQWRREIERLAKEEEGTPKIIEIFEDEEQTVNSRMERKNSQKVNKYPKRSEMDHQAPIYVIDEDKPNSKIIHHVSRSQSATSKKSSLPYTSIVPRFHDGKDVYYGPANSEIKGNQSRRASQSSKSHRSSKTDTKRSRSSSDSSSHKCPQCGHDLEEKSKINKNKKGSKGFLDDLNCFGNLSKHETRL